MTGSSAAKSAGRALAAHRIGQDGLCDARTGGPPNYRLVIRCTYSSTYSTARKLYAKERGLTMGGRRWLVVGARRHLSRRRGCWLHDIVLAGGPRQRVANASSKQAGAAAEGIECNVAYMYVHTTRAGEGMEADRSDKWLRYFTLPRAQDLWLAPFGRHTQAKTGGKSRFFMPMVVLEDVSWGSPILPLRSPPAMTVNMETSRRLASGRVSYWDQNFWFQLESFQGMKGLGERRKVCLLAHPLMHSRSSRRGARGRARYDQAELHFV